MNNVSVSKKKLNKLNTIIFSFYSKITLLSNQIEFLFRNKFIIQDIYIEYMNKLNNIYNLIIELESYRFKKISKSVIENLIKNINTNLENICIKCASNNCKNTLDIYIDVEEHLKKKNNDYNELFELLNIYFIPLSSTIISNDIDKFIKKYNITKEDLDKLIIMKLIDISKINSLVEKINGATIIFYIDNKIIYINGFFNKDSFNIFKNYSLYKNKIEQINEKMEFIQIPNDFKEKYIEQISIKDFIIEPITDIINLIKNDYNDFLNYKNKSLSALIKEFIKSNIEKQRKIIILFLIADQEYQFTANIIFDLITDKSFLADSQNLSDIIYNSLNWKIQKIFKISNENFETNKKKLENININNIPYESRILALQTTDNIKAKAMEKLKEINGSKDNSVKAQQWLDGFLKIPFNVYKKEPIINFFKNYQTKIENYIDIFTIKISEYNVSKLNNNNNKIYSIIIQIIDEFHSTINKSEYSYNTFIKYLENVKILLEKELGLIEFNLLDDIKLENNNDTDTDKTIFLVNNKDSITNTITDIDNSKIIVQKIIDNNLLPDEKTINNCVKQLEHFKKIKNELAEENIINEKNINTMINKLTDLESMLNVDLFENNNLEDYNSDDETVENDNNNNNILQNNIELIKNNNKENIYNINFKKYIIKNIGEIEIFINKWNNFKLKKKEYLENIDKILNKCTYGQNDAKKQMKRIIGQWMNGNSKGQCFGLCGPPGVGKTTLCKNGLAKCLFDENNESRPFAFLPLGGATNGSILEGHHYTYLGSTWGKIIDILIETKCMNPIIYIDELDKISKTEHGREIISILTHITDQSQNKEFYDRYFSSIPIDLSQILFIFSYNDKNSIDRILRDRIQEIHIKPLSIQEKLVISQNYILPEILNNVGFSNTEIIFTNNILKDIINKYTYESGVRKLNEILYDIIRDINLKKIEDINSNITYPLIIDEKLVEPILSNISPIVEKKIYNKPMIGIGTGLYASGNGEGHGGITLIQVMKTISDKKFSIEKITGSLGDSMKESVTCAMTVAWNIIPDNIKKDINDSKDSFGLHIHCGDISTKKDGPSASIIITVAIISRLINIPLRNDVAITGEMDLQGNSMEIGGLYSKLQGALSAGVKKVLIPKDNEKDLDIIFKREEEDNIEMQKLMSKLNSQINIENDMNNNDMNNDTNNDTNNDNINNINNINNNDMNNNDINDMNNNKSIKKRLFRNKMEIVVINDIYEALKHTLIDNDICFKSIN